MPLAAGECGGERCPVTVDDQVVLGAGAGPVDGQGTDVVPPFQARTCEPSTALSSRSKSSARRNSLSRAACRRGHTPASVQSRSRRQAVTPEQPTVSAGTSRRMTPVRSTYMTPATPSGQESARRTGPGRHRVPCRGYWVLTSPKAHPHNLAGKNVFQGKRRAAAAGRPLITIRRLRLRSRVVAPLGGRASPPRPGQLDLSRLLDKASVSWESAGDGAMRLPYGGSHDD